MRQLTSNSEAEWSDSVGNKPQTELTGFPLHQWDRIDSVYHWVFDKILGLRQVFVTFHIRNKDNISLSPARQDGSPLDSREMQKPS